MQRDTSVRAREVEADLAHQAIAKLHADQKDEMTAAREERKAALQEHFAEVKTKGSEAFNDMKADAAAHYEERSMEAARRSLEGYEDQLPEDLKKSLGF